MLRVLIVDDDPDILATLAEILPSFVDEIEIDTASSAEEALPLLGRVRGYGAVVRDERMPRMHGLELLARVRAAHPGTLCILMSAFTDPNLREAARRAGVDLFLVKPFTVKALAESLEALLPPAPALPGQPSR
jgi:CheY-like chemotaxis protein